MHDAPAFDAILSSRLPDFSKADVIRVASATYALGVDLGLIP